MRTPSSLLWAFALIVLLLGCKKAEILSAEKQLLTFTFPDVAQAQITIDQTVRTIKVIFPRLTDVKSLKPTITVSPAAMVSPATGVPQDFSKPVVYTVKAEDGSTQTYTVSSAVTKLTDKMITGFKVGGADATIDQTAKTIKAELPAATDLTKLTPTITLSTGATVAPASGVVQDFSKDVVYTVTAEDGILQTYTVSLTKAKPPVVLNGNNRTVYFGDADGISYALDANSGLKRWQYGLPTFYLGSPIVSNKNLFFGGDIGNVFCMDTLTGKVKWNFNVKDAGFFSSPYVINGVLYIGSKSLSGSENKVFALNADTGAKIWEYNTKLYVVSTPIVVNNVVYIGGDTGKLFALNATNGGLRWIFDSKGSLGIDGAITEDKGVIYATSSSRLYAINAITGNLQWEFKIPFSGTNEYFSSPIIKDGTVYVSCTDTYIYAINSKDGTRKWAVQTGDELSTISIADGLIYAGGGKKMYAVSANDGSKKWQFSTTDFVDQSTPTVANGVIYFGSDDGKFYALNSSTGTQIWTYKAGNSVDSSPCVVTKKGEVYRGLGNIVAQ